METHKFEEAYKSPECITYLVKTGDVICQSQHPEQPKQIEETIEEELF